MARVHSFVLRSLPRDGYLDRLIEAVPPPKEALLRFGLPRWKLMPLECKIPVIPGPKDAYAFQRCELGKSLWSTDGPRMEFRPSHPFPRETGFPYDALHDPHLLEFFSRPINLKRLLRANLLTRDMRVPCSLREFNSYRRYLREVHAARIREELRKRDYLSIQRRALGYAEERARKEAERLRKRKKLAGTECCVARHRASREDSRVQRRKERAYKVEYRLRLSNLVAREKRRLMNVRREKRIETIRQKCRAVSELARRDVFDVYIDRGRRDEMRRERARNKRLADIARRKRELVDQRWRRKVRVQENDLTLRKTLSRRLRVKRQRFIDRYERKVKREIARMQKLLDDAKLATACHVKRRLPRGRTRVCCKRSYERKKLSTVTSSLRVHGVMGSRSRG